MPVTRFLTVFLLTVMLLAGAGCGRDASFQGGEASPLSCDVAVLGDTLGAYVSALEAAGEGASVILLYGNRSGDQWLLEAGAAAAPAPPEGGDGGEGVEVDVYSTLDLRRALGRSGGAWGKNWHFDLLASAAYDDLHWFAGWMNAVPEQSRPGLFRLPLFTYDQAYMALVRAAGERGVRFISGSEVEEINPQGHSGFITVRVRIPGGKLRQIHARTVIMAQGGYLEDRALMQETAAGVKAAPWRAAGDGEAIRQAIALGLDLVQLDHFAYSLAIKEDTAWFRARYPEQAMLVAGGQIRPVRGLTQQDLITVLLQEEDRSGLLLVAESHLREGERDSLEWARYAGIESFMEAHALDMPWLRRWFDRPWDNFYGAFVGVLAEYCLGGIAVNEQGQVLKAGEPVSGLYALGEAAGGLHGRALLPGAALSEALVWGRRIGRAAAHLSQM